MSWKSKRNIRTCLLICNFVFKFYILLDLRALIYVLSCETLKMFWFIGSMFWNLPYMEVKCDPIYVECIVEIGKIVHNVDAC